MNQDFKDYFNIYCLSLFSLSAWTCQSTQRSSCCDVNTRPLFSLFSAHFSVFFFPCFCPNVLIATKQNECTTHSPWEKGENSETLTLTTWNVPKKNKQQNKYCFILLRLFVVVYNCCQCCVSWTHTSSHTHAPLSWPCTVNKLRSDASQREVNITFLFLLLQ